MHSSPRHSTPARPINLGHRKKTAQRGPPSSSRQWNATRELPTTCFCNGLHTTRFLISVVYQTLVRSQARNKRIVELARMTTKVQRAVVTFVTAAGPDSTSWRAGSAGIGPGEPCVQLVDRTSSRRCDRFRYHDPMGARPYDCVQRVRCETKGGMCLADSVRRTKWIDDDCRKNPSDSFYGATAALIRKFRNVSSPCSTLANGLTCPVVPVSGVTTYLPTLFRISGWKSRKRKLRRLPAPCPYCQASLPSQQFPPASFVPRSPSL
jgi:hypothetical protein